MPLLSIITINYNNLTGLKRTVLSVVSQTFSDYEYILIDGGSTDGSVEFIKENKGHFSYWVSESDNGIFHAMNKGISKSNGEYLLFLNSGDEFYCKSSLEQSSIELHTNDLICFDLICRQNQDIKSNYPDLVDFSYLWKSSIGHPSTFSRKELFNKVRFDESLKIVSDWKFFLICILKKNATYRKVNSILTVFYLDGISSDIKNLSLIREERNFVLQEHFGFLYNDLCELERLKNKFSLLKSSRKIRLLQYFRIIDII